MAGKLGDITTFQEVSCVSFKPEKTKMTAEQNCHVIKYKIMISSQSYNWNEEIFDEKICKA